MGSIMWWVLSLPSAYLAVYVLLNHALPSMVGQPHAWLANHFFRDLLEIAIAATTGYVVRAIEDQ